MSARIIGIGTALPANSISQPDSCSHAKQFCCYTEKQERVLEQVYRKTKIEQRSTVVPNQFFLRPSAISDTGPSTRERMQRYNVEAGPLADTACRAALHNASLSADKITHLVTVSCTGFAAPGFDLHLFKSLRLPPTVQRTHIGFMGCHGALNALRITQALCNSDPAAVVLLCATELCSVHFQYGWHADAVIANSLFADGAAALILCNSTTGMRYSSSRSFVVPETENAMTWQIGDSGFKMTLASEVPELVARYLPKFIRGWLTENGLALADIQSWAVHPGGPRILDAVEDSLHLDQKALLPSRQILSECGNMSSPTVLFILERLAALQKPFPCVMLGFGPGLTIEACLIR